MTGKYRKLIIVFMIVALAVLNIWRWWPASSSAPSADTGRAAGEFGIEDFEVKAIPVDSLPPMSRDIFFPKKVAIAKSRIKASSPAIPAMPVKTPEEMARDAAQAEFAQIQCAGISVRNERIHAYLISAGEPLLVSNGDKVGSRFVVEKITTDGVTLRDPETGVGGMIAVSGKK
jgi:hypothetical protein